MDYKKEEIAEQIKEWAADNIGSSFVFREYQLESIVDIVYNILLDEQHNQIIEAPTGSGKSLINIISAGVLADYYDIESYILCSDLYLWKQYEDFINKHMMIKHKFGMLKGQTGNYTCAINKQDMRNADCRMAGISWANLFNGSSAENLGYSCAKTCKYVKARKKALKSKVILMTYALYHFQINIVPKLNSKTGSFKERGVIFCDECHNIPSIVSSNFAPTIKYNDADKFAVIHKYMINDINCKQTLFAEDENDYEDINPDDFRFKNDAEIKDFFYNNIYDPLLNENASKPSDNKAVNDYLSLFKEYLPIVDICESNLAYKKQHFKDSYTEEDVEYYKACSWFRNMLCFWSDIDMIISEVGFDYILKEVHENKNTKQKEIIFKCVKEDYLSWHYLLKTSRNRVMLSATTGGLDAFSENVGIGYSNEEPLYNVIPSTFEFKDSPINFLNRYKMSYAYKNTSFPKVKDIIYKICTKRFPDSRGVIQTGSYANAKEIYDNAPAELQRRFLLYNGSKEKTLQISIHQMSRDTILLGPTLVEGVDLPDDQCRFIIIAKVPYPVITDDYVKKKIELFPKWYNSHTSNIIIQGIGRGIRSKKDFCTTYILDACFLSLYNATKEQYPKELQDRLLIYK